MKISEKIDEKFVEIFSFVKKNPLFPRADSGSTIASKLNGSKALVKT